jgi:uncharacterized protein YndB with AHSA1/START domain
MSKIDSPVDPRQIELVVTRAFKFDPEVVFDAWLDPATVGKWLFATQDGQRVRVELTPRVGGKFVIAEKRGDQVAEHFGEFLEIERPERLAFSFATDHNEPPTIVTIDFTPKEGGCELTLKHKFDADWAERSGEFEEGWNKILEGLDRTIAAGFDLVIRRVFDAPRERVFACWTEREHLMKWFCPKDFTVIYAEVDVRPGGAWRWGMRSPDGEDHKAHGVYREVLPPEKLVFTFIWERDDGTFKPETLITVALAENEGKTQMTFTHAGIWSVESRDAHEGGWNAFFDHLGAYLEVA